MNTIITLINGGTYHIITFWWALIIFGYDICTKYSESKDAVFILGFIYKTTNPGAVLNHV